MTASLFTTLFIRVLHGEIPGFNAFMFCWVSLSAVTSLAGIFISGSYKVIVRHSTLKSVNKLLVLTLVKEALMLLFIVCNLFSLLVKSGENHDTLLYLSTLFDMLITFVLLVLTRIAIINGYENLARDSYAQEVSKVGVVVYGTSSKSVAMATRLSISPNYKVLGFLSPFEYRNGLILSDLPVYSYADEAGLADLRNRLGFECVIFADHDSAEAQRKDELSLMCVHTGIHVLNTPRIEEVRYGSVSGEVLKDVYSKEMIIDGMSPLGRVTKRIFDASVAAVLIVVFSPLYLVCWLAIKLDDRGPAIYRQERIGRFGKPFNILKFRSMRTDAEAAGPALYAGDDDPRLTKVGRFLRLHHLDELPQLFNVLVGDMSFIGWRPERQYYIDKIMKEDPRYYYLYQIRPGVTSYSTLKNGYTDTMEKMLRRLEFDLYYLRHRSWKFDIEILFKTFVNIVFGKKF